MVISTVNQVVYQGDGVTTAWPFTFRILDDENIKLLLVNRDGSETAITSDYWVDTENSTVYYPGYAPGAEPPLADQPPKVTTTQKIVVYRDIPVTQEKNLGDAWPFYVIELGLDKLTMILQEVKDIWDRCLKVSMATDTDRFDPTIPVKAGKVFRVNDKGTGFTIAEDYRELAKQAMQAAEEAKDAADKAYRITPEALKWMENFVVGEDGKFYQVMEEE